MAVLPFQMLLLCLEGLLGSSTQAQASTASVQCIDAKGNAAGKANSDRVSVVLANLGGGACSRVMPSSTWAIPGSLLRGLYMVPEINLRSN